MELKQWGWTEKLQKSFLEYARADWRPARVLSSGRTLHRIADISGERDAGISGKARDNGVAPVAGDWVLYRDGKDTVTIEAILPRMSAISRKVAGVASEEQLIAANVDVAFIVQGLGGGRSFNLRALERYLTVTWDSGCRPVVVLNKTDLSENVDDDILNAESVSPGVVVTTCSAFLFEGIEQLRTEFEPGQTAVLLGPSGAGKSSLLNALAGKKLSSTAEIRGGDGRGRHTTTRRELFLLDDGRLLLDTPGLRELQLWGDVESLNLAFPEIQSRMDECRFRDCRHETEPGCAVRAALADGLIENDRFESWLELRGELMHLEARKDEKARQSDEKKWRKIAMDYRAMKKGKAIW